MIVEKKYWGQGYGTEAVKLTLEHIYSFTEINIVYLHTLESNLRAQASFKKSGLTEKKAVARNRYNFIRMEITRSEWVSLVQSIK